MDIVKHLIGLGANVGQRNAYRQTAYDVATSHIVRQYLLPLQLRVRACTDSRVLLSCLLARFVVYHTSNHFLCYTQQATN